MDMSWESLVWPLLTVEFADKGPLARAANGVLCVYKSTCCHAKLSVPPCNHQRRSSCRRCTCKEANVIQRDFERRHLFPLSVHVLIPSISSTSNPLCSNETSTIKQRDLSVSGHKLLCSSRN